MKTTTDRLSPQAIGGMTRRLLATQGWEWRHTDPTEPIALAAAKILRRDAAYAAAWLAHVSAALGYPLPHGNGTNGPWQRIGCVTPAGRYGMVCIATGLAVETDTMMPWRVSRFAAPITRAQSCHAAGGSGGIPSGWRQIALTLSGQTASRRYMPDSVTAQRVTWGLSTCYGTCGLDPRTNEYTGGKWARLTCEWVETSEPQREELSMGIGVQAAYWEEFSRMVCGYVSHTPYISMATLTTSGGNYSIGEEKLVYIYMRGTKLQRELTAQKIRKEWKKWLGVKLVREMYFVLKKNGVNLQSDSPRLGQVSLGYLGGNRGGQSAASVLSALAELIGHGQCDGTEVQI